MQHGIVDDSAPWVPGRVLVTGGLSALGAAFSARLLAACPGLQLRLLDAQAASPPARCAALLADPRVRLLPAGPLEPSGRAGAPGELDGLAAALAEPIDAVVHLLGFGEGPAAGPLAALAQQALGAQHLLEAARAAGDPRVLLLVPAEVYGAGGAEGPAVPVGAPFSPETPAAVAAAAAAQLGRAAHALYGQPVLIVVADAPFGEGQGPGAPLVRWIAEAWARRPVSAGPARRGWLPIEALADGLCAALLRGRPGGVLHLGAPERRADVDVAGAILEILGRSPALLAPAGTGAPLGAAPLCSAASAASLDWRPAGRFDDALAQMVEWAVEHRGA